MLMSNPSASFIPPTAPENLQKEKISRKRAKPVPFRVFVYVQQKFEVSGKMPAPDL
jgi:hypothetical protein